MGRSRSRRRRGKSGGQGSGGSGKGKGTGGSRGRSSGTRGGQGKGGSGKGKGTGGSKGRSNNTRGGQSKANRNQNKKARSTVKSVKKAVGSVAKGIGKSLRGAAANAAGHTKKKSKLQQQFSNLRNNIHRQSTPEAKKQRRADRLRRQFGLDYSSMNPSFKVDVSVDQAARRLGIHQNPLYKRLPRDVRNWKFKYQTQAPTKRGIRDGYRAPDRGGQNIASNTRNQLQSIRSATPGYKGQSLQGDMITGRGGTGSWLDFYRPENQRGLRTHDFQDSNRDGIDDRDQYTTGQPIRHPGRIDGPIPDNPIRSIRQHPGRRGPDQFCPGYGIPGRPRPIRGKPQPDTIAMMYENILGRKADQGGLDYWKNELSSGRQTKDNIRENILRSDEFKGRSEADRIAATRGVKRRRAARGEKVGVSRIIDELDRRGIKHSKTGSPPRRPRRKGNRHFRGRAKPTGRKPTGRGLFPSIAASMAARGLK